MSMYAQRPEIVASNAPTSHHWPNADILNGLWVALSTVRTVGAVVANLALGNCSLLALIVSFSVGSSASARPRIQP